MFMRFRDMVFFPIVQAPGSSTQQTIICDDSFLFNNKDSTILLWNLAQGPLRLSGGRF
jgi:hypothetical protein